MTPTSSLEELPERLLNLLILASCLGSSFELQTLVSLSTTSEADLKSDLDELIAQKLLSRIEDGFRFKNDRDRAKAYAMLSNDARTALHLQIGQQALDQAPKDELPKQMLDSIDRLSRDLPLNRRIELLNLVSQLLALDSNCPTPATTGPSADEEALHEEVDRLNGELKRVINESVQLTHQASKAELATSVLHNVGNVLNSISVTAELLRQKINKSSIGTLPRVVDLINAHVDDIGAYLTEDPKGKLLPEYFQKLCETTAAEHATITSHAKSLIKLVEHIKTIIVVQQNYAKTAGLTEWVCLRDTIEDAIRVNEIGFRRTDVIVETSYIDNPRIQTNKQKVVHILVNLLNNAKYAASINERNDGRVSIQLHQPRPDCVRIDIVDNGVGIAHEHLNKLFTHGFTTKKEGHGFGLHSAYVAAEQLGGTLTGYSDGVNRGATFTLELPITT